MGKLSAKKCFLLDMDGTIYLGNEMIPGADKFLEALTAHGIRYIFLTNNSSKSKVVYLEKLRKMELPATIDHIFTSGEATTVYLNREKPGARIFLLGTPALEEEFVKSGFTLVRERNEHPDYVVLGFDTTLTYEKLWIGCDYIMDGVPYIATHPDFVCPVEGGRVMPDIGAMIEMIKYSTYGHVPLVIGKPNRYIVEAVLAKYDLRKEEVVIVGDRLYTDIRTGTDNGMDSILVLSGETDRKMLAESEFTPTYVFDSVKDIIREL